MDHSRYLLLDVLSVVLSIWTIVLFWENTLVSALAMFALVLTVFMFFHKKEDLVFYITGAVLGPTGEIICIFFGVWIYNNPLFLGIPLWLPLLWGFVFLMARRIRDVVFKMEHIKIHYQSHHRVKGFKKFLLFDFLIYLLLIIVIINIWQNNLLLFIALSLIMILLLINFHYKEDIFFILIVGILGPIAEIICIHYGAWAYGNPSFLGIPAWLPVGYGLFAVIVRRASIIFNNLLFAKK